MAIKAPKTHPIKTKCGYIVRKKGEFYIPIKIIINTCTEDVEDVVCRHHKERRCDETSETCPYMKTYDENVRGRNPW